MGKSNAIHVALKAVPLALPEPISTDSVKSGPSYFIVPVTESANSNLKRAKHPPGDPKSGAVRVATLYGSLGKLIDCYVTGVRPRYQSFYTEDREAFYSHLSQFGADLIFMHVGYGDVFEQLKLDPSFCDIPVVLIDSFTVGDTHQRREEYTQLGAAAVLFIPFIGESVLSVLDELLPKPGLDDGADK
jgi:hypothetical protein